MDNAFHFALICEFRGRHYLRMYSLDLKNTQLVDIAPELKNRSISDTASTLILDESYDSFVLCSNSVFQRYKHALSPSLTPSMTGTLLSETKVSVTAPVVWDLIEDGKYLIADARGQIFLLVLAKRLSLTPLGHVDALMAIHYLDNRVVFTASYSGPSRLLRIHQNHLEVVAEYPNQGPIIDVTTLPDPVNDSVALVGASGYDSVRDARRRDV